MCRGRRVTQHRAGGLPGGGPSSGPGRAQRAASSALAHSPRRASPSARGRSRRRGRSAAALVVSTAAVYRHDGEHRRGGGPGAADRGGESVDAPGRRAAAPRVSSWLAPARVQLTQRRSDACVCPSPRRSRVRVCAPAVALHRRCTSAAQPPVSAVLRALTLSLPHTLPSQTAHTPAPSQVRDAPNLLCISKGRFGSKPTHKTRHSPLTLPRFATSPTSWASSRAAPPTCRRASGRACPRSRPSRPRHTSQVRLFCYFEFGARLQGRALALPPWPARPRHTSQVGRCVVPPAAVRASTSS